jgi:prepilin peptidase CpaA
MPPLEIHTLIVSALYGWLLIVLILCAITDLRSRRIPNLLTYATILAAPAAYGIIGGWDGLLFSLGGLACGFALLILPYLMGGMGAGDVKLMSGVGAVLGLQQTAVCFVFIALCGGVMAVGYMVYRRNLKETLRKTFLSLLYLGIHKDASLLRVDKEKVVEAGIPYGVAIGGGVLLYFAFLTLTRGAFINVAVF